MNKNKQKSINIRDKVYVIPDGEHIKQIKIDRIIYDKTNKDFIYYDIYGTWYYERELYLTENKAKIALKKMLRKEIRRLKQIERKLL